MNKTFISFQQTVRLAGGQVWEDSSLADWEEDDFRIFCGDLGNDVNDELLTRTFNKYGSFLRARVIRDKRTGKSKGFGFVSFREPADFIRAMKEMDGKKNYEQSYIEFILSDHQRQNLNQNKYICIIYLSFIMILNTQ